MKNYLFFYTFAFPSTLNCLSALLLLRLLPVFYSIPPINWASLFHRHDCRNAGRKIANKTSHEESLSLVLDIF